jgi:mRNA-degrading endonuclease RelE of RelBE toxin-antitoxin system
LGGSTEKTEKINCILFTKQAEKQLLKLDRNTQKILAQAIGTLLISRLSGSQIKELKSPAEGFRLRKGDYRILFIKNKNQITIHDVGHRKDVYK